MILISATFTLIILNHHQYKLTDPVILHNLRTDWCGVACPKPVVEAQWIWTFRRALALEGQL